MSKSIEEGGWEEVLQSSVILQGPYDGGTYTMREFYEGLETALNEEVSGYILGLGPLVKRNEYYLAVNSREVRNKLIQCGSIVVKHSRFTIRATDTTRFVAKVHWAPPFTPSSAIEKAMGNAVTVEKVQYEMSTEEGYTNVATGIRLVTMVGDRKKIPHLATITNPINGQQYELLVTVPGRPPLCLRCKLTGHFRRACRTPFCRHHKVYGHTTEECVLKKASYANAASRNVEVVEETAEPRGEKEQPTAGGAATRPKPLVRDRVGETQGAAERPTPAPRPPHVKAAERNGRTASLATRQNAAEQNGRAASPATRSESAERDETAASPAMPATRSESVERDETAASPAMVSNPSWESIVKEKEEKETRPSTMLSKALSSEDSMTDEDENWVEVPEAESEWTKVVKRKRKGSNCSDSPRHESDESSRSKSGEGGHSTRKKAIVLQGKIQKLKSSRKTLKKK